MFTAFKSRVFPRAALTLALTLALPFAAHTDSDRPAAQDTAFLETVSATGEPQTIRLRPGEAAYQVTGPNGTTVGILNLANTNRFIVELTEPPLALRARPRGGEAPSALLKSARAGIDAQHARVLGLIRSLGAQKASTVAGEPPVEIGYEYQEVLNGIAITAPPSLIQQLRLSSDVKAVHEDGRFKFDLTESVPLIGAAALHAQGVTGEGVTVGIIDSGIDYNHPDLGAGFGPGHKVIGGYDFANNDDDPMDDVGHGTHVAGIVAAEGGLTGVAPRAKLVAYKVGGPEGVDGSSVIAAVERAVNPDGDPSTNDRLDVINLSLGGPGDPDDPVARAVDAAVASGVVVVVAAGNSGLNYGTIDSPGVARGALTVGASFQLGRERVAPFSSRGPVGVGPGFKPELVAPGGMINSTLPGGAAGRESGTSMAAPHVAGAAALLLQARPGLTPEAVKSVLMTTAVDMRADPFTQGTGRIDVAAAARRTTVVSPAAIGFGVDDGSQPTFTANTDLAVSNLAAQGCQVSARAAESGLPAGIVLSVSPAQLDLAPGASATLHVALSVDNASVPDVARPPFAYQGRLQLRCGDEELRVPVMFQKAAMLQLSFDKAPIVVVARNENGDVWSRQFPGTTLSMLVSRGAYEIYTLFTTQSATGPVRVRFDRVVRHGVRVESVTPLTIRSSEAVNVVADGVRDEHGERLLPSVKTLRKDMIRRSGAPRFSVSLEAYGAFGSEWAYSNLDEKDLFDSLIATKRPEQPDTAYSFAWHRVGLNGDWTLTNEPTDLTDLQFRLDADPGTSSTNRVVRLVGMSDSQLGGLTFGMVSSMSPPFVWHHWLMAKPSREAFFGHVIYGIEPQRDWIHSTPVLHVSRDRKVHAELVSSSGPSVRTLPLYETSRTTFDIGLEPFAWSGRFENAPDAVRLASLVGPYGPTSWLFSGQSMDLRMHTSLPFELRQGDTVVSSGALDSDFPADPIPVAPGAYTLTIQGPNGEIAGSLSLTKVSATFDTSAADPNPPFLSRFEVLANGVPAKAFCVTDRAEVRFRVRDEVALQRVRLMFRAGREGLWLPLLLQTDGEDLVARLPLGWFPLPNVCAGQTKAVPIALRLIATDTQGNSIDTEMTPGYVRLVPTGRAASLVP